MDEQEPELTIEELEAELKADPSNEIIWLAAQGCANAYDIEKNWHSAAIYYRRALKSELAQQLPDIFFRLAWCSGKLKDYSAEEKAYRSCLGLDPDYGFARNNLGWSLMKQHRYEEALEVFEESIKCGKDGKHPIWNKYRVLKKLGRYSEAIQVIQNTNTRGKRTAIPYCQHGTNRFADRGCFDERVSCGGTQARQNR